MALKNRHDIREVERDDFKESEVMLDNIKKVPSKTKFKMRSKNVFVG